MVEATDAEALANLLPDVSLIRAGAHAPFVRGIYRLEYVCTKTRVRALTGTQIVADGALW